MSADTSTTKPDLETRCRAMFERDTRDWEVKILHDEGLYRHFIARNNRRFGHHAEIVTVPHSLTISTGFGSATFRRIEDMLNFFGTGDVNADYWAEKCDTFTGRAAMRGFDMDEARRSADAVMEASGIDPAVWAEHADHELADGFGAAMLRAEMEDCATVNGVELSALWENDFTSWDYGFLWTLHAIPKAIAMYRAARGKS